MHTLMCEVVFDELSTLTLVQDGSRGSNDSSFKYTSI